MPGILPDTAAGGVAVQDGNGNATNPANVLNVYVPPAAFNFSCTQTGLPNDCTARIYPSQINALMSELICLAERFDPDGAWNCTSTCNVSTAVNNWLTETGTGTLNQAILDAITGLTSNVNAPLTGNGTAATPYDIDFSTMSQADMLAIAAAFAGNATALTALAVALAPAIISAHPDNSLFIAAFDSLIGENDANPTF